MTMRTFRLMPSFVLLAALLGVQFAVLLRTQRSARLVGDEIYFVERARLIASRRALPSLTVEEVRTTYAPGFRGNSDWRPPAYPLVLAALGAGRLDVAGLRRRAAVLQFAAGAAVLFLLHAVACRAGGSPRFLIAGAGALGVQPWTLAFAGSLLADSFCASLVSLGAISLFLACRGRRRAGLLALGSALEGAALLFRPDAILLGPPLVATAVFLCAAEPRERIRLAFVGAAVFCLFVGMQVGYRHHFSRRLELFGPAVFFDQGAFDWVHTWCGTEKLAYEGFVYRLTSGEARIDTLPGSAFGNDAERVRIARALNEIRESGNYGPGIDASFEGVARARVRANPMLHWVVPRLFRSAILWLNLETSSQLLDALTRAPRMARRGFLGGMMALKGTILLLSILAAADLVGRVRSRAVGWGDPLTVLCLVLVWGRTAAIGLVLGWSVNRYMLPAWPAILWLAIAGAVAAIRRFSVHPRSERMTSADGSDKSAAHDLAGTATTP